MLNGLFNLLSYVGINKYWAEKTSLDRASALFESTQIKALAAEKDRLILRLMAANKTAASGALSASVTHELAQPLTALGLNLSSLKHSLAQSPPDAEQQRLLERCVDNTQRLHAVLRTVRSMFLTNEIAEENFAIGSVLESVASLAEMEAQRHGITLSIDGDGERIIRGRPSELQHALLNLTLNAMEALSPLRTPEKKVNIRAVEDNEALRIIVSDNGPGVSADMLERIFDMLDSDKPGGMGLGLWLCRHIAERHGGSIMHRPNLPSGAIFEFVLPNRPPVAMMEND
jgi:signal transduction histidine kinase